jgi:hypothetical protein
MSVQINYGCCTNLYSFKMLTFPRKLAFLYYVYSLTCVAGSRCYTHFEVSDDKKTILYYGMEMCRIFHVLANSLEIMLIG